MLWAPDTETDFKKYIHTQTLVTVCITRLKFSSDQNDEKIKSANEWRKDLHVLEPLIVVFNFVRQNYYCTLHHSGRSASRVRLKVGPHRAIAWETIALKPRRQIVLLANKSTQLQLQRTKQPVLWDTERLHLGECMLRVLQGFCLWETWEKIAKRFVSCEQISRHSREERNLLKERTAVN